MRDRERSAVSCDLQRRHRLRGEESAAVLNEVGILLKDVFPGHDVRLSWNTDVLNQHALGGATPHRSPYETR